MWLGSHVFSFLLFPLLIFFSFFHLSSTDLVLLLSGGRDVRKKLEMRGLHLLCISHFVKQVFTA